MWELASRIVEQAAAPAPAPLERAAEDIPFVQDKIRASEHIRHVIQQRFREVFPS
ncbi:hypothetical protein GCM10025783_11910 [Amnibacterium soli]|uniref:Uncharacterized protein n=1 Tax=Amnibacterium soli TaxID=1282736 RepID=A0ABP8YX82_9MICO